MGEFCLFQLYPRSNPRRVKLSWLTDLDSGLDALRATHVDARPVKSWPCPQQWGSVARRRITEHDCWKVSPDIYDTRSLDLLVSRCDWFFTWYPSIQIKGSPTHELSLLGTWLTQGPGVLAPEDEIRIPELLEQWLERQTSIDETPAAPAEEEASN
ncbi:MAG: hypothetical protein HY329_03200 [Chloroflexi bacterium]|nr:hypothetical protein [Chloroflexota bacterium]